MRFAVSIVSPPGYPHSAAFAEVALCVHEGLRELGHDSVLSTRLDNRRRTHIVFGAHLLERHPQPLPADAILFNLEQVQEGSKWFGPAYLALLRRHTVWDYSAANVVALEALGVAATEVPIGHVPALERIRPQPADIDVLFYGSVNPRRQAVLHRLQERGARVHAVFGAYGAARDALIARAALVLNLHFYEARVFEIVRVSYLLANGVCVVSETGADPAIEQEFAGAIAFAPYEQLVERCLALRDDPAARAALGARAREAMRARPMRLSLQRALSSARAG